VKYEEYDPAVKYPRVRYESGDPVLGRRKLGSPDQASDNGNARPDSVVSENGSAVQERRELMLIMPRGLSVVTMAFN